MEIAGAIGSVFALAQITYAAVKPIIQFIEITKTNSRNASELLKQIIRLRVICDNAEDSQSEVYKNLKETLDKVDQIATKYIQDYNAKLCSSYSAFKSKITSYWEYKTIRDSLEQLDKDIAEMRSETIFGISVNTKNVVDKVLEIVCQNHTNIKEIFDKLAVMDNRLQNIERDQKKGNSMLKSLAKQLDPRLAQELKSTEREKLQQSVIDKLKQDYKDKYKNIKRLVINTEYSITESYVNLTVAETDETRSSKPTQEGNTSVVTDEEDKHEQIISIEIQDLFKSIKGKQTKRVLVFGAAGMGKTTFCQYVTYRWAEGKLFQQYKLLFWIKLRSLSSHLYQQRHQQPYTLVDIVKQECLKTFTVDEKEAETLRYIIENQPSEVLWLLDGYDEVKIPDHLKPQLDQLMSRQHRIVTTRATATIPPQYVFDTRLKICGFTDEMIQKYVQQFFDYKRPSDSEVLIRFLQSNPNVYGMCQIPISLEIFCISSDPRQMKVDIREIEEKTRPTITKFYHKMLKWLLERYNDTENEPKSGKKDVLEKWRQELQVIETIAFQCIDSANLDVECDIFERVLENTCCNDSNDIDSLRERVLKIGVLSTLESDMSDKRYKVFSFIHSSFQEFFAARYLKRLLEVDNDMSFVKENKYLSRFELVFTFLAGLLNGAAVDSFFRILMRESLDIVGVRHLQLLILCLEEISMDTHELITNEILYHVKEYLNWIVKKQHYIEYSQDLVLYVLGRSRGVLFRLEIEQTIKRLLSGEEKCNMCSAIEVMDNCSTEIFEYLLILFLNSTLDDVEKTFNRQLCRTLCVFFRFAIDINTVEDLLKNDSIEGWIWKILLTSLRNEENIENISEALNIFKTVLLEPIKQYVSDLCPRYNVEIDNGISTTAVSHLLSFLDKSLSKPILDQLMTWIADPRKSASKEAIKIYKMLTSLFEDQLCDEFIRVLRSTTEEEVINVICDVLRDNVEKISLRSIQNLDELYCEYQSYPIIEFRLRSILLNISETFYERMPEYVLSLSRITLDKLIETFLTDNKDKRISGGLIWMLVESHLCDVDEIMSTMLNKLGSEYKDNYEVAFLFFEDMKEELVVKYNIIEIMWNFVCRWSDLRDKTTEKCLISLCRKVENYKILKPLVDTISSQINDETLKDLAVNVLGETDVNVLDQISTGLFDLLNNEENKEKQQRIVRVLGCLAKQSEQKPYIIDRLLTLVEFDTNSSDLLAQTTARVWSYVKDPDDVILTRALQLFDSKQNLRDSIGCLFRYLGKVVTNCQIVNQIIERIKENDDISKEAFRLFCSDVQHPEVINHLVDLSGNELDTNVKEILNEILTHLGKKPDTDRNSRARLLDVLCTDQFDSTDYDSDHDQCSQYNITCQYLLYFDNQTITDVLSKQKDCAALARFPLTALIEVYGLTGNPLWLEMIVPRAIENQTALTIADDKTGVLLHDDEIERVCIKDSHILNQLVEVFSDQRKELGFVLDGQDEVH